MACFSKNILAFTFILNSLTSLNCIANEIIEENSVPIVQESLVQRQKRLLEEKQRIVPNNTDFSSSHASSSSSQSEISKALSLPAKMLAGIFSYHTDLGESLITEVNRWWLRNPMPTLLDMTKTEVDRLVRTLIPIFDGNEVIINQQLGTYYNWQRNLLIKKFKSQSATLSQKSPVLFALFSFVNDAHRRNVALEKDFLKKFFIEIDQASLYTTYQDVLSEYLEKLSHPASLNVDSLSTISLPASSVPVAPEFDVSMLTHASSKVSAPPLCPGFPRPLGQKKRLPSTIKPSPADAISIDTSSTDLPSSAKKMLTNPNAPKLPENFTKLLLEKSKGLKKVDRTKLPAKVAPKSEMEEALEKVLTSRRTAIAGLPTKSPAHSDHEELDTSDDDFSE